MYGIYYVLKQCMKCNVHNKIFRGLVEIEVATKTLAMNKTKKTKIHIQTRKKHMHMYIWGGVDEWNE